MSTKIAVEMFSRHFAYLKFPPILLAMQEVENIRVVVRLRPFSQEELESEVEDFVEVDGQVLTVKPPAGTFLQPTK